MDTDEYDCLRLLMAGEGGASDHMVPLPSVIFEKFRQLNACVFVLCVCVCVCAYGWVCRPCLQLRSDRPDRDRVLRRARSNVTRRTAVIHSVRSVPVPTCTAVHRRFVGCFCSSLSSPCLVTCRGSRTRCWLPYCAPCGVRFAWARSRLPRGDNWRDAFGNKITFTLSPIGTHGRCDGWLPKSHTCFFQVSARVCAHQ